VGKGGNKAAVVATKTMAVTAMVGGTDNSQLKGAAVETRVPATVTVAETVTAAKTAKVIATITTSMLMPMPTMAYQGQQDDKRPGMCLAGEKKFRL
jgi:hypothetical protein